MAFLAALMALCAWIAVPLGPVPFTMQSFGFFVALGLLGGRQGTAAYLVYMGLGLIGLPVFAGFSSGPGALFGPTGGYLLGFLLGALAYWAITARLGSRALVPALLAALLLNYAAGTLWFALVYTGSGASTLAEALALCVAPYVLPDLIKLALAVLTIKRIRPHLGR